MIERIEFLARSKRRVQKIVSAPSSSFSNRSRADAQIEENEVFRSLAGSGARDKILPMNGPDQICNLCQLRIAMLAGVVSKTKCKIFLMFLFYRSQAKKIRRQLLAKMRVEIDAAVAKKVISGFRKNNKKSKERTLKIRSKIESKMANLVGHIHQMKTTRKKKSYFVEQ